MRACARQWVGGLEGGGLVRWWVGGLVGWKVGIDRSVWHIVAVAVWLVMAQVCI